MPTKSTTALFAQFDTELRAALVLSWVASVAAAQGETSRAVATLATARPHIDAIVSVFNTLVVHQDYDDTR